MEKNLLPQFPLVRFRGQGMFFFYYSFGTNPAEDLLQTCFGVEQPSVLSLGCGDIRSCFYTLWKHFSVSDAPKRFNGAHFLLNDCNSAVLARNILFLYLCVQLPEGIEERRDWLCSMWAIWYCHNLFPGHQQVLDDSLRSLLKHSESCDAWVDARNPLHSLVEFTSPGILADISQVWRMWLEGQLSVEKMHSSRNPYAECVTNTKQASIFAHDYFSIYGSNTDSQQKKAIPEILSYLKSGNSYAEDRVFLPSSTSANLTLFDNPKWEYTSYILQLPFSSYYHTYKFLPNLLQDKDAVIVPGKRFETHPLLANCVQQFFMWIQSSSKALTDESNAISFTFNNKDALIFCQEVQHSRSSRDEFDVIHSSNLVDYLGFSNVILCSLPLLKPKGQLLTQSMRYYNCSAKCIEDLLALSFGFDCKLLPVILGARCINYEGVGYASPVSVQPIADSSILLARTLIWQRVSALPMLVSELPVLNPGNVTEGLVLLFMASTINRFIRKYEDIFFVSHNNIESALLVLKTFVSSCKISGFHFFEPLCAALKEELKPFLSGLQAHALLHGLHMHLTVEENSCPMCLNTPIEEYLGLFCVEVPIAERALCVLYSALIHPYSSLKKTDVDKLAFFAKDIQVIDCFDGFFQDTDIIVGGTKLMLNFFAPLHFVDKNYNVTISVSIKERNYAPLIFHTFSLHSLFSGFKLYNFSKTSGLYSGRVSKSISSNVYAQDCVTTEISLSDSLIEGLSVSSKKISCSEIQLVCGDRATSLKYAFPVNYSETRIKLCKAEQKIVVVGPRDCHSVYEEQPMLIASPDNHLSLPSHAIQDKVLSAHFSKASVSSCTCASGEKSSADKAVGMVEKPVWYGAKAKESFHSVFLHKDIFCFHLKSSDKRNFGKNFGRIFVARRLFDYELRVPALDVCFCFFEDNYPKAVKKCSKVVTSEDLLIDDETYQEMKKALLFFARRTNGSLLSGGVNCTYQDLVKRGVDSYFTRAVVYILYGNPDAMNGSSYSPFVLGRNKSLQPKQSSNSLAPSSFPSNPSNSASASSKCSFCGKEGNLKKCMQCGEAQYCDKDCQSKHWRRHKNYCKKSVKVAKQHSS